MLGSDRVRQGDVVVGLASSGLHSNGYSLIRAVVRGKGWSWEQPVAELGRTLGEELLEPTRLYAKAILSLADGLGDGLHAAAHVTGGGLAANLSRVLRPNLGAVISRSSWPLPPILEFLRSAGGLDFADQERALNMGLGMVVVLDQAAVPRALADLAASGQHAIPIGRVVSKADLMAEAAARASDASDLTTGSKGVTGGTVLLTDEYSA
jgi:phosphoribosylformylglycinamidine cyclo-ligase